VDAHILTSSNSTDEYTNPTLSLEIWWERTGHPPSCAEAKKMKLLNTSCPWLGNCLWDCHYVSSNIKTKLSSLCKFATTFCA